MTSRGSDTVASGRNPVSKTNGLLVLAVLLSLLAGRTAYGQQNSSGGVDFAPYNFGFIIALNTHTLRVVKSESFRDTLSMRSVHAVSAPGFNLGIASNLRLNKYLDLRFTPALCFVDRSLDYKFDDPANDRVKTIESTYLDFPLALKLKSSRHRNVRFYLVGGFKYSYDIVSPQKITKQEDDFDPTTKKVKLNKNAYAYEFGCGFDFYYPYFKFSPEIRFSNGINNILLSEKHLYSSVLDQLFLRAFTLTFHFEG